MNKKLGWFRVLITTMAFFTKLTLEENDWFMVVTVTYYDNWGRLNHKGTLTSETLKRDKASFVSRLFFTRATCFLRFVRKTVIIHKIKPFKPIDDYPETRQTGYNLNLKKLKT